MTKEIEKKSVHLLSEKLQMGNFPKSCSPNVSFDDTGFLLNECGMVTMKWVPLIGVFCFVMTMKSDQPSLHLAREMCVNPCVCVWPS